MSTIFTNELIIREVFDNISGIDDKLRFATISARTLAILGPNCDRIADSYPTQQSIARIGSVLLYRHHYRKYIVHTIFIRDDPMFIAARHGHDELVTWLMTDEIVGIALAGACYGGHEALTRRLLALCPDVDPPVYYACAGGNVDIARQMLDLVRAKKWRRVTFHKNECIRTACLKGHVEMVRFLLSQSFATPARLLIEVCRKRPKNVETIAALLVPQTSIGEITEALATSTGSVHDAIAAVYSRYYA